MVKFRFTVSTGYAGSERSEIIEIPDEELQGMTEIERDDLIWEEYKCWMWERINTGYEEVE